MNARQRLEAMIRTDRGDMTVWSPPEVQNALNAYRAEVLADFAALVDAMLTEEPDTMRASALYEVLLKLRAMQPCSCARSQGLHEKACRKYVPGHELLSQGNALAAYRAETNQ